MNDELSDDQKEQAEKAQELKSRFYNCFPSGLTAGSLESYVVLNAAGLLFIEVGIAMEKPKPHLLAWLSTMFELVGDYIEEQDQKQNGE